MSNGCRLERWVRWKAPQNSATMVWSWKYEKKTCTTWKNIYCGNFCGRSRLWWGLNGWYYPEMFLDLWKCWLSVLVSVQNDFLSWFSIFKIAISKVGLYLSGTIVLEEERNRRKVEKRWSIVVESPREVIFDSRMAMVEIFDLRTKIRITLSFVLFFQSNTYFVLLRQREIQWYILTSLVEQRLCIMYCIFCDG